MAKATFTYDLSSIESIVNVNLQNDLDQFISNMSIEVKVLQMQGMSNEDIIRRMVDDFKNQSGAWKTLEGKIGSTIDFGLNNAANFSANEEVVKAFPDSTGWQWMLEPTADHCETCLQRDGQVKSYQDWESVGVPGAFGTICRQYCQCTLIPAGA